jgi:hypothetical protein
MTQDKPNTDAQPETSARHTVRIPGFTADSEVGLGDVIKRATSRVGVRPCEACRMRAARLNRWIAFSSRR